MAKESYQLSITQYSTQEEKNLALLKAIKTDKIEHVTKVLDLGAATNFVCDDWSKIFSVSENEDFSRLECSDISPFIFAVYNANKPILNLLLERTPEDNREELIHANYDLAFICAVRLNKVHTINLLLGLTKDPIKREQMIHTSHDEPFICAAEQGDVHLMNLLLDHTQDAVKREKMIHAQNDTPFINATFQNKVHLINLLFDLTQDTVKREQMIHAQQDAAFRNAAEKGNMHLMNLLLNLTQETDKREQMIHGPSESPFQSVVHKGNMHGMKLLLDLTEDPLKREKMIHVFNDSIFSGLLGRGKVGIAQILLDLTKDPYKRKRMIHLSDNQAFAGSLERRMEHSLKFLLHHTPNSNRKLRMTHGCNEHAWRAAFESNYVYSLRDGYDYGVKLLLAAGLIDNVFSDKIVKFEITDNIKSFVYSYIENPIGSFINNNDDPYLIDLAINSYKDNPIFLNQGIIAAIKANKPNYIELIIKKSSSKVGLITFETITNLSIYCKISSTDIDNPFIAYSKINIIEQINHICSLDENIDAKLKSEIDNILRENQPAILQVKKIDNICKELVAASNDYNEFKLKLKETIDKEGSLPAQAVKNMALLHACSNGKVSLVQGLLSDHADKNVRDIDSRSALLKIVSAFTCAISYDYQQILNILLQGNIDINLADIDGSTALHHVVYMRNKLLIDQLLSAGADPNVQDKLGNSPLHLAVQQGDVEIIDALLAKKANPQQSNYKGETAFGLSFSLSFHEQIKEQCFLALESPDKAAERIQARNKLRTPNESAPNILSLDDDEKMTSILKRKNSFEQDVENHKKSKSETTSSSTATSISFVTSTSNCSNFSSSLAPTSTHARRVRNDKKEEEKEMFR